MNNTAIALFALLISAAATQATPRQKLTHPVAGSPQSIGAFANGCIVGAQELPLQADNYQVMRTDQRRYFGHPDLVLFIQRLSNQCTIWEWGRCWSATWGCLPVGVLTAATPAINLAPDVDIFLQLPKARWSTAQLLKPQALDLVSRDGKQVVPELWKPEISSMIKLAAQDNDVTRIFVNPAIKQQLYWTRARTATGCGKCARGSSTVRICMCACAARQTASSVKISRCRRPAMDVAQNCKVGSNRRNPAAPRLRKDAAAFAAVLPGSTG